MLKDTSSKVDKEEIVGYYDQEDGYTYCIHHSNKTMLPIMEHNEDYWGSECAVCGKHIADFFWPED
jgi:hypothetical protein